MLFVLEIAYYRWTMLHFLKNANDNGYWFKPLKMTYWSRQILDNITAIYDKNKAYIPLSPNISMNIDYSWNQERFIWISFLKESKINNIIARMPKDIVTHIAKFLTDTKQTIYIRQMKCVIDNIDYIVRKYGPPLNLNNVRYININNINNDCDPKGIVINDIKSNCDKYYDQEFELRFPLRIGEKFWEKYVTLRIIVKNEEINKLK